MPPGWGELVAPGELGALEAAAGSVLPFRLGRQLLAGPGRVGGGVLEGDLDDRMVFAALDAAARGPPGAATGAGGPGPPVAVVGKIDRAVGHAEDQRPRHQHPRVGAGVEGGIDRPFGDRDVAGRGDEGRIVGVRHGGLVDPEAADRDLVRRAFVGVVPVGAHQEAAAGDEAHRAVALPGGSPARSCPARSDAQIPPGVAPNCMSYRAERMQTPCSGLSSRAGKADSRRELLCRTRWRRRRPTAAPAASRPRVVVGRGAVPGP